MHALEFTIGCIVAVLTPKFPTIGPLLCVLQPVAPIITCPDRPVGVVPKYNIPVVCLSPIKISP